MLAIDLGVTPGHRAPDTNTGLAMSLINSRARKLSSLVILKKNTFFDIRGGCF